MSQARPSFWKVPGLPNLPDFKQKYHKELGNKDIAELLGEPNRQSLAFSERGQLSQAIPQFHVEGMLNA